METKQLEATTGFVIYDLPDADNYVGPARLGAKLTPANAVMLVRHQTYVFAVLEQRRSGCTIGFKVDPDGAAEAIAAAAGELAEELESQKLSTWPDLRLDSELPSPLPIVTGSASPTSWSGWAPSRPQPEQPGGSMGRGSPSRDSMQADWGLPERSSARADRWLESPPPRVV